MPFGTGKKRCPSPCHAENGLRQKFCVKCSRSFVEASEMRKMAKRAKMLKRGREMHQRNVSTILNGIQAKVLKRKSTEDCEKGFVFSDDSVVGRWLSVCTHLTQTVNETSLVDPRLQRNGRCSADPSEGPQDNWHLR